MWIKPNDLQVETYTVLDEEGQLVGNKPEMTEEDMVDMYKWMLLARIFDERTVKLQRQGRVGTYAPLAGQEAAQVGSAYALEKEDWVFPTYRETAVSLMQGVSISQIFLYVMGHVKGSQRDQSVNVFPVQIIIAAQTLHGMGSAWASKYLQDGKVSVAYIGDGGTSQGDFHEALNFAGVMQLPVIFFVQNNQWAISVPVKKQTASETIAQKAIAYGIHGVRVDGNDVLAVHQTMKEAVKLARLGKPVLIEAVTYRQGPHTTADDPTKYRPAEDAQTWLQKDPLLRFKKYLMHNELWDEDKEEQERVLQNDRVSEGLKQAEDVPRSQLSDIFDYVYEESPKELREQKKSIHSNGGI